MGSHARIYVFELSNNAGGVITISLDIIPITHMNGNRVARGRWNWFTKLGLDFVGHDWEFAFRLHPTEEL